MILRQASSVRSLPRHLGRTSARTAPGICDAVSKRCFSRRWPGSAWHGHWQRQTTDQLSPAEPRQGARSSSVFRLWSWVRRLELGGGFRQGRDNGSSRSVMVGRQTLQLWDLERNCRAAGFVREGMANRHRVLPIDGAADGKQKMSTGVDRGEKAGRELQRPRASSAQKAVRDAFNSANVGPST